MKQRVKIIANDRHVTVAVTATITTHQKTTPTSGLSSDEQKSIKKSLQRALADALRCVSGTSFGPENTKVR